LFAVDFEPRKGLPSLFSAWRSLRERPRLVLTGDAGWRESRLRSEIEPFVRSGEIEMTGYVPRERLRTLYQDAIALVYPAEGEGFGLPPLEAMAAGTPVLACRSGAIEEVLGEDAILSRPGDTAQLASQLTEVIASGALRREFKVRGVLRARRLSWSESARLMEDVFEVAGSIR